MLTTNNVVNEGFKIMCSSEMCLISNDELSRLFTNRFRYFLSYLQKINKSFSKFLLSVSGNTESISKQPTQLIVELNSSLQQKVGTIVAL